MQVYSSILASGLFLIDDGDNRFGCCVFAFAVVDTEWHLDLTEPQLAKHILFKYTIHSASREFWKLDLLRHCFLYLAQPQRGLQADRVSQFVGKNMADDRLCRGKRSEHEPS